MIRVENLKKDFGRLQVLKGVTEEIRQNEVVSIIGPSGSGKSTLLRCLNLLEVPSSGKIYFHDVDLTDKKVDINVHRQKMGMVFQHFNVFPNMTVEENITMAPVLLGKKNREEAHIMAAELLNASACMKRRMSARQSCPAVRSSALPSSAPSPWNRK